MTLKTDTGLSATPKVCDPEKEAQGLDITTPEGANAWWNRIISYGTPVILYEMDITPAIANYILANAEHLAINNRKITQGAVSRYARTLAQGSHIACAGTPIMIDTTGHIGNGLTRTMAVRRSGYTGRFLFQLGVSNAALTVTDKGNNRTVVQQTTMEYRKDTHGQILVVDIPLFVGTTDVIRGLVLGNHRYLQEADERPRVMDTYLSAYLKYEDILVSARVKKGDVFRHPSVLAAFAYADHKNPTYFGDAFRRILANESLRAGSPEAAIYYEVTRGNIKAKTKLEDKLVVSKKILHGLKALSSQDTLKHANMKAIDPSFFERGDFAPGFRALYKQLSEY